MTELGFYCIAMNLMKSSRLLVECYESYSTEYCTVQCCALSCLYEATDKLRQQLARETAARSKRGSGGSRKSI